MTKEMSITPKPRKGIKGKHKYKIDCGTAHYYRYYKKHAVNGTTKSKFDAEQYEFSQNPVVSKIKFKEILSDYFMMASEKALTENTSIKLFGKFGKIEILKNKPVFYKESGAIGLPVDWVASKKAGKKVYYTNDDRDGYVYKWKWTKSIKWVKGISWYKFVPTRHNKRTLTKILQNKSIDFFEVPKYD